VSESLGTHEIQQGSERNFGLVFAAVFLIIGLFPLISGDQMRYWAIFVSAVFAILALFAHEVLKTPNRWWFKFGLFLGRFVSPIVIGFVFFIAVTPTGLIMRLLGKDLLRQNLQPDAKTYWLERNKGKNPMGSMKNQF